MIVTCNTNFGGGQNDASFCT